MLRVPLAALRLSFPNRRTINETAENFEKNSQVQGRSVDLFPTLFVGKSLPQIEAETPDDNLYSHCGYWRSVGTN